MAQFLANIYGILATIPFLSFFLIFIVTNIRVRDKKESLKWAIHITMLLLLSSVSVMMQIVTGSTTGFWWIVVGLILAGGLLAWLQWKIRRRILLARVIRAVWYLGFLVLSISYIVLFISGIVIHVQYS